MCGAEASALTPPPTCPCTPSQRRSASPSAHRPQRPAGRSRGTGRPRSRSPGGGRRGWRGVSCGAGTGAVSSQSTARRPGGAGCSGAIAPADRPPGCGRRPPRKISGRESSSWPWMGVSCHLAHALDSGGELGAAACRCISAPATLGRLQELSGPGCGDCDRGRGPWERWRDRRPEGPF